MFLTSGSRIFIDNSTNNLVLKLGTSGEAIELSSNKVIINFVESFAVRLSLKNFCDGRYYFLF